MNNISFGLAFRPKGGLGLNSDVNKHPSLAMLKTPSPQSAWKAGSNLAVLFTALLPGSFLLGCCLSWPLARSGGSTDTT